ncbi:MULTISPECIES: MarR family winged helix-turn-helix transcriptional regulator [unclassified Streptomyces]|uniref:MarR family transcriptional regulator n=1 Tax=Streptomyces sp. NBC_00119 TaxID=2975659 RepID=A0AAU1TY51_9ACTN|nr:MarR family transcriptional regulator [Streptomyces sp. NBC_00120]MCX5323023.1 MarR family transcriptional regulator [Streptomyces sp. NBC_00120]
MNGTDTPADGTSGTSATLHAALDGLGPLARQLGQIHTRLWHEQVHQDLTGPQFTVLGLLRTHGPMDQGTLGTLASLDKSTAAPMLERLKRRGLVAITKDDKDRRRKLVTITDAGRELATTLAPAVVGISEEMLAHFNPVERDQFLRLMRRAVEGANQ